MSETAIITPEQSRAARGLLNWSQDELAKAADKGRNTVRHFEAGRQIPSDETLTAFRGAMEKAGVIFIPSNGEGPGARLAKRAKASAKPKAKARGK